MAYIYKKNNLYIRIHSAICVHLINNIIKLCKMKRKTIYYILLILLIILIFTYFLSKRIKKKSTAVKDPSSCFWKATERTHSMRGQPQSPDDDTLNECKEACLRTDGCDSFDFDEKNKHGMKCWLILDTSMPVVSDNTITAVHYQYVCYRDQLPPSARSYDCVWIRYGNWKSAEPRNRQAASDASACKAACLVDPLCFTVDFVEGECFFTNHDNQLDKVPSTIRADHYRYHCTKKSSISDCIWITLKNTLSSGGSGQPTSLSTWERCRDSCSEHNTCQAFDFDANNPNGIKCWFSDPKRNLHTDVKSVNVSHSILSCANSKNPLTEDDGVRMYYLKSVCNWHAILNSRSILHRFVANISSKSDCQSGCYATSGCYGIDWRKNIATNDNVQKIYRNIRSNTPNGDENYETNLKPNSNQGTNDILTTRTNKDYSYKMSTLAESKSRKKHNFGNLRFENKSNSKVIGTEENDDGSCYYSLCEELDASSLYHHYKFVCSTTSIQNLFTDFYIEFDEFRTIFKRFLSYLNWFTVISIILFTISLIIKNKSTKLYKD